MYIIDLDTRVLFNKRVNLSRHGNDRKFVGGWLKDHFVRRTRAIYKDDGMEWNGLALAVRFSLAPPSTLEIRLHGIRLDSNKNPVNRLKHNSVVMQILEF